MVGCSIQNCKSRSVKDGTIKFFSFPSNESVANEWLRYCGSKTTRKNGRVCSLHFIPSDYQKSLRHILMNESPKRCRQLKPTAVPTLHVNTDAQPLSCAKPDTDESSSNSPSGTIPAPVQLVLPNGKLIEAFSKEGVEVGKSKTERLKPVNPLNLVDKETNKSNNFVNVEMEPKINVVLSGEVSATNDPISVTLKMEKIDEDDNVSSPQPELAAPELNGFPDMAQFCESLMKVSKETQTSPQPEDTKQKKRKLDPTEANEHFIQTCNKNLPRGMVQLVKWHLNSKENGDNYKFHMFALNLYFSGANTYNQLKEMMGLPDIKTIKKHFIPKTTKFDNNQINALKIKVDNMSDREKICSLSISSMQLEPQLYYNITRDKVEGFQEIDGVQKMEPARYALVFMAQGILEKWSQPIAYAFITHHENSSDISVWVEEILTLLIDVGLDVKAFVSDPKTELLYMKETQKVTPEKPYFTINNKKIYYIYDIEELSTYLDKHLRTCNFHIKGSNSDGDVNKLLIRKFNKVWLMLNSTTHVNMSPFKRAYSNRKYQNNFLNKMLTLLQNLKVISRFDDRDITKDAKYIDSIQVSILSIMQLYDDLKKVGAKMLLTRRLTQACLNKFFRKTRNKDDTCTIRQFKAKFSRCFVYNMLKKPVGDGKRTGHGFSPQCLLSASKCVNQSIKVGTTDYSGALPAKRRFTTVCRYLYLKCIEHHSCDSFKEFLSRSPETRQYVAPYRASAPLCIWNCKLIAPWNFTYFIKILEKRFRDCCRQDVKVNSIGHQILKKIASIKFDAPCSCFPTDYLKKLFVRLRIFYAIRENNDIYRKRKNYSFNSFNL